MLQRAREGLLEQERLERTKAALQRSQGQLRRAKEKAELGAAARASLLATVSHEVRTPVHAIIGLAGLLLDSSLPPGQARFLSLIRSSSETLLAVLNDMLDASRLESGGLALETRAFDLRRTVDEALDVVAVRAAERGIDLNCQVDLAVPEAVVGRPGATAPGPDQPDVQRREVHARRRRLRRRRGAGQGRRPGRTALRGERRRARHPGRSTGTAAGGAQ